MASYPVPRSWQASRPPLSMRVDGWSNLFTGLGSSKDKLKFTRHKLNVILTDDELESIFIEDGLGTRIVKLLPDDLFREGWEYTFPDKEEEGAKPIIDVYMGVMEEIKAVAKLKEGVTWARLYGGAVVLIGALDGQDLEKPLNTKRIRTFDSLRIIDRSDIDFALIRFQLDPNKPRYGLPESYPIKFTIANGVEQIQYVHHTRIIEIHGNQIPAGATRQIEREQRYWGVSVLQNVYEHLQILGSSIGSIGALLNEVSVGKYKLADLVDILDSPDGEKLIKKRMEVMDLCRSVFNSVYLDKEDEYTRDDVSFAGIPDVLYNIYMLVSACTGYPITRLFGVSPAGMNSTGESDMRNYYDMVRSTQRAEIEPLVLRLVRIIAEWKNLEEPYIEWKPLQQLSEKEKAEKDKTEADKDQVIATTWKAYIDMGAMEPYEVRFMQFGDSLDKIQVPEEDILPPIETVPEEEGGKQENNAGKEGAQGEDAAKG